jgi:hypothetical protein
MVFNIGFEIIGPCMSRPRKAAGGRNGCIPMKGFPPFQNGKNEGFGKD